MKFSEDRELGSYSIKSYAAGEVSIIVPASENQAASLRSMTRSFIIGTDTLNPDWPPQTIAELKAEDIEQFVDMAPEIVLLGSGAKLQFPNPALLSALMQRGIGFEVMDTAAACRTYNILLGEGRRVAAGLMMI